MNIFLQILAFIFLALGIIGIFLPILPTTPFLLLATFIFSKSNPKIHQYLLNHKYLGPPIRDWEIRKVIRPKAKALAVTMILAAIYFKILKLNIILPIKILVIGILLSVVVFILTRKSK